MTSKSSIYYFVDFLGKTWYEEFKRLSYNVPLFETETLQEHRHQVLHVSFSHNGKYFATCSKDGYVMVINCYQIKKNTAEVLSF